METEANFATLNKKEPIKIAQNEAIDQAIRELRHDLDKLQNCDIIWLTQNVKNLASRVRRLETVVQLTLKGAGK